MNMISYSSNFEDVMLARAFARIPVGTYIDVGAHTPEDGSNTYALYARGWSGVACDPIFNYEVAWAQQWRALRPRDFVVRDAIGASMGETEFWLCNVKGLSSCSRPSIDKCIEIDGQNGASKNGHKVPVVPLNRVIEKLLDGKAPELVCIDVEGFEGEVLKGIDLTRYRPWLFVIESYCAYDNMAPHYHNWESLLTDAGYEFVWDDRLNRFYLAGEHKEELEQHFKYPPNHFDHFMSIREYELQRQVDELNTKRAILINGGSYYG